MGGFTLQSSLMVITIPLDFHLLMFLLNRIDVNFVIKVSDFGLSESIDITKDYFRQDNDSAIKLPIKWMALESINFKVFSEKSDVVSSQI